MALPISRRTRAPATRLFIRRLVDPGRQNSLSLTTSTAESLVAITSIALVTTRLRLVTKPSSLKVYRSPSIVKHGFFASANDRKHFHRTFSGQTDICKGRRDPQNATVLLQSKQQPDIGLNLAKTSRHRSCAARIIAKARRAPCKPSTT